MKARAVRPALAAAALALFGAVAAVAAPVPLTPVTLSAGGNAAAPQVAVDPAGDAVVVWSRNNGGNDIVQAANRRAGGVWSAPVDLSGGGNATEAQVAIDDAGNAVAVWARFNGSRSVIQAATMAAGGGWSAPVDLSNAEWSATAPQVAISAAGNAVAVWSRYDGLNDIVQTASRPAGGGWSAAVDLSSAGRNATEPQVAIDDAGNAVAVWSRYDGFNFIIQSSGRSGNGAWSSPPTDLSAAGGPAGEPQVAIGGGGEAVAVWSRNNGSRLVVQAAARSVAGVWSGAADLSAAGLNSRKPQVSVAPGGEAAAVWVREAAGFNTLAQAAVRPAGGGWSGPTDLSSGSSIAEAPEVAIDQAGDAVVLWSDSAASPSVILSATRPAGAGWEGSRRLSELGENSVAPQVALGPDGNGVGVWTRELGSHPVVEAIGFDGTAPQLQGLSIPATATMEKPVSFSVSAFDVWSPIASIRWSFGDDAGATGSAVANTYARPGTYRTSVVVADALGRTATASGTVTVYAKARTGRNVLVKKRRARLGIICASPAGCEGVAKLIAPVKLKRGERLVRKRLAIGTKSFAVPGSSTTTVSIPLTKPGLTAVRKAGRRGLKTQLTGPGIKHRLVALIAPRR